MSVIACWLALPPETRRQCAADGFVRVPMERPWRLVCADPDEPPSLLYVTVPLTPRMVQRLNEIAAGT